MERICTRRVCWRTASCHTCCLLSVHDFFTVDPESCAQKKTWPSRCLILEGASLHLQFAMSITSIFLVLWLVESWNTVESWNDVWEWGALKLMQKIIFCSAMKACAGLREREVIVEAQLPSRHVEQCLFWRCTVRSFSLQANRSRRNSWPPIYAQFFKVEAEKVST